MLDFAVVSLDMNISIDAAYEDYMNEVQVECDDTNENTVSRFMASTITKAMRGFKSFELSNTKIADMAGITSKRLVSQTVNGRTDNEKVL
jgi:hypothetical protein